MTLLFSMLRGCSESVPVPLNSRGSLVTQCHWYRMLKCNDESTSYGETGALYASYPSLRPKPISLTQRSPAKKKNATFKRERAAPRSQREGGKEGSEQTPPLTSGRPQAPAPASPCVLRLSRRDTDILL